MSTTRTKIDPALLDQLNEWVDRMAIPERSQYASDLVHAYAHGMTLPAPPAPLMVPTAKGKVPGDAIPRRMAQIIRAHEKALAEGTDVPTHNLRHVPGSKATAAAVAAGKVDEYAGKLAALVALGIPETAAVHALATLGIVAPVPAPVDPRVAVLMDALGIPETAAVELLAAAVLAPVPTAAVPTVPAGKPGRSPKQLANDDRLRRVAADKRRARADKLAGRTTADDRRADRAAVVATAAAATVPTVAHDLADLAALVAANGAAAVSQPVGNVHCPACGDKVARVVRHRGATRQAGSPVDVCERCAAYPSANVVSAIGSRMRKAGAR